MFRTYIETTERYSHYEIMCQIMYKSYKRNMTFFEAIKSPRLRLRMLLIKGVKCAIKVSFHGALPNITFYDVVYGWGCHPCQENHFSRFVSFTAEDSEKMAENVAAGKLR